MPYISKKIPHSANNPVKFKAGCLYEGNATGCIVLCCDESPSLETNNGFRGVVLDKGIGICQIGWEGIFEKANYKQYYGKVTLEYTENDPAAIENGGDYPH
jgi:hypothetical protein